MNQEDRVAIVFLMMIVFIITVVLSVFTLSYIGIFDIEPIRQEEEPEQVITNESCLVDKQNRFDQLVCMDNRIQELEERIEYIESIPHPE